MSLYLVKWGAATRFHTVNLLEAGGIRHEAGRLTPVTPGKKLFTDCGRELPEVHTVTSSESISIQELNNSRCEACWNTKGR